MAHPDLFALLEEPAGEQVDARSRGRHVGAAELGGAVAALDPAAEHVHHHLLAITDPEDRHPEFEHLGGRARAAGIHHRGGSARQDHRAGREVLQESWGHLLIGVDLAIDVQLAQAARDQLGDLAAEVDDEKALMRGAGHGAFLRCGNCRRKPAGPLEVTQSAACPGAPGMSLFPLNRRYPDPVARGGAVDIPRSDPDKEWAHG